MSRVGSYASGQELILAEYPNGDPKFVATIEPGATVAYFRLEYISEWDLAKDGPSRRPAHETMCYGFVKYDGCCEMEIGDKYADDDTRTWHFCGRHEMTEFFNAMVRLRYLIMQYIKDAVIIEEMTKKEE